MRSKLITLLLAAALLALPACNNAFPEVEPNSAPEKSFSLFYEDIRNTYPFFEVDGVDWEALGRQYRPQVTAGTTEAELFDIMSAMLTPLLDGHASLNDNAGNVWVNENNFVPFEPSFSLGNLLLRYSQDTTDYLNRKFFAFQPREGILYIYIPSFLEEGVSGMADDAIRQAERTGTGLKGLILDVRNNGGGFLKEGEQLAGLFTDMPFEYADEKYKNGPAPNDFAGAERLTIQPYRSLNFTKPARLLTNRFSASTSERLRLAVEQLPDFRVIGDTTFGATSPIIERGLPNGFKYVLVSSVTLGLNGQLYERIGIPPQIRVTNTLNDLRQRRDRVFDRALAELP